MKRILLIGGLQLIAFWEVWRWYLSRAVYSWDQPWGLLAFVAAFVFLFASRKSLPEKGVLSLFPQFSSSCTWRRILCFHLSGVRLLRLPR